MAFKLQFITISSDGNSRKVIDTLVLDASLSEIHESEADVTEFPVEQGADITDNVRVKPKGLQVEALISDFHLSNEGRTQASSGGPPSSQRPEPVGLASLSSTRLSSTTAATSASLKGAKDSAKTTLKKLEDYQSKGTLIDVETGLKSYRNMVIKSLHTPRDRKLKSAVKTTIILKAIIIAQSQSVVIRQSIPKGQGTTSKGQKTAKGADAGKENQSLLFKNRDLPATLKKAVNEALQGFGFGG